MKARVWFQRGMIPRRITAAAARLLLAGLVVALTLPAAAPAGRATQGIGPVQLPTDGVPISPPLPQ